MQVALALVQWIITIGAHWLLLIWFSWADDHGSFPLYHAYRFLIALIVSLIISPATMVISNHLSQSILLMIFSI
jgi:hypothetical protein